jgi:hypothetical protein
MPQWASAAIAASPWAAVAIVGLALLFVAFVILMVRSAKTNMVVRITWKSIEIRRGTADSGTSAKLEPRLRSVDVPRADDEHSAAQP